MSALNGAQRAGVKVVPCGKRFNDVDSFTLASHAPFNAFAS